MQAMVAFVFLFVADRAITLNGNVIAAGACFLALL